MPMPNRSQQPELYSGRRLWTCETAARSLLVEGKGTAEPVMLQHARIADSVTKAKDEDKPRLRRFRISTETKDRHGDVVRSKGIQLKNFRRNPVVLFAHDSRMPPIGKSPRQESGAGFLDADVDFFERDVYDFADTIFRIVSAGGLKATSIGFMPIDWERLEGDEDKVFAGVDFKKVDLLEFSIVPVPANPEAVARAFSDGAAMDPYKEWLEDMQDNFGELKELLADLGLTREDFQASYKAASGQKHSVQLDPMVQDKLRKANLKMMREQKELEEFSSEDLTLHVEADGTTDVVGDFPEKCKMSKEILRLGEPTVVQRQGDAIAFNLKSGIVTYKVVKEIQDILLCERISAHYREDIQVKEFLEKQEDFSIQSVLGRKTKWKSKDDFLKWAKRNDFKTDELDETRQFWRLRQHDQDGFGRIRTLSVLPPSDKAGSEDCRVQVMGGPLKQEEQEEQNPVEVLANIVRDLADVVGHEVDEESIAAAIKFATEKVESSSDEEEEEEEEAPDLMELVRQVSELIDEDTEALNAENALEVLGFTDKLLTFLNKTYPDDEGDIEEVTAKAGRVLSRANEGRLRKAAGLLQEVLEQMTDEEEDKSLDDDDEDDSSENEVLDYFGLSEDDDDDLDLEDEDEEEDEEEDTELSADEPSLEAIDADELRSLIGDSLKDQTSEVIRRSVKSSTRKLTGALD